MDEEVDLLRRAQRGDGSAFDQLVELHLQRCYRIAYLITRNEEDASDALQEGLIRAFRYLNNVTPDRPFAPWFVRVVVNEALKQGNRKRSAATVPLPELPSEDTPERALLAREEREQVWQAVQSLSPEHRAVVVLRYYADLSEREMAEALGVSPGTIKSRLHYARSAIEKSVSARRSAP